MLSPLMGTGNVCLGYPKSQCEKNYRRIYYRGKGVEKVEEQNGREVGPFE